LHPRRIEGNKKELKRKMADTPQISDGQFASPLIFTFLELEQD